MKFIQTDNQVFIRQRLGSYGLAAVFVIVGIILVVTGLNGATSSNGTFILVGAIFALAGSAVLGLTANREVTIVANGATTIAIKRLFHATEQNFPTSTIKGIRLVTSFVRNGQKGGTILLVMENGASLVIMEKSGGTRFTLNGIPLSFGRKSPLQKEASQLSDFLHVPLDQNNLTSIAGITNTVQEVMHEVHGDAPSNQLGGLVPPQLEEQYKAAKEKQAKRRGL